jgi:hypothetical protein
MARRGLIQRGGQVVLHMLPNVQQATIKPLISDTVAPGTAWFKKCHFRVTRDTVKAAPAAGFHVSGVTLI